MNISAINAATSAYGVNNKNSTVAATNQSDNVGQNVQSDTITISEEGARFQKDEKLAILEQATSLFMSAQKDGEFRLQAEPHNRNEILSENFPLLETLEAIKPSSYDEKVKLDGYMSMILSYGDKEVFSSVQDIEHKYDVLQQAATLFINDVIRNPESYPNIENKADLRMLKL